MLKDSRVGDIKNSAISWKKLLARDMLGDDFSEKIMHALHLTDLQLR
jgi:hypothetical protein